MPASVWIINLVVLGAVCEADLGHRRITFLRLLRPLLLCAGVVALYFKKVDTTGRGLVFEVVLLLLGIALGLTAASLFRVYRDNGSPWSHAGMSYAALWVAVVGARLAFVYATYHSLAVDRWLRTQHLSSDTVTDALLFMAIAMVLARTASLRIQARRLGISDSDLRPKPPVSAVIIPATHI
jgi:hypothetical protein